MEESKKENFAAYLLAVVNPFFGLFLAIYLYMKTYAKNLFWLWCAYMGSVFIFDPEGGSTSDCVRYANYLNEMYASNFSFFSLLSMFYSEDNGSTDIYQPLITYIVSLFTNNAHVLFFIFAAVFGYFYSRNLWFVIENSTGLKSKIIFILYIAFALVCPIWLINGVRMWTAFHVFLYGLLPFLLYRDKSKLLWCFVAIFIHFSYVVPLLILLSFFFLPKNINLLFLLYLLAQLVSELNIEALNSFLTKIIPSNLFVSKVNGYVDEEYSQKVGLAYDSMSAYVRIFDIITKWAMVFLNTISWTLIIKSKSLLDGRMRYILSFVLFFGAIASVVSNIPSGSRFLFISNALSIFLFIILYKDMRPNYKKYCNLATFMLVPYLLIQIRESFYFYGFDVFVQNIITSFWINNRLTIDYYLLYLK